MLHLENFFEKSFALLLTTPSLIKKSKNLIDKRKKSVIIKHVLKIPKQLYLHNTQLEGG